MKPEEIYERQHKAQEEIDGLVTYMKLKIKQEDWHGVADAAMDIRELVERIRVLNEIIPRL